MTMQTDLFHGPRYWWAAYCRRWAKMNHSSPIVFLGTAASVALLVLVGWNPRWYLIIVYWMLSLQVCYDDDLPGRTYQAWAGLGLLITAATWSLMTSESLYIVMQMAIFAVCVVSSCQASERKLWIDWWNSFTKSESASAAPFR